MSRDQLALGLMMNLIFISLLVVFYYQGRHSDMLFPFAWIGGFWSGVIIMCGRGTNDVRKERGEEGNSSPGVEP